MSDVPESTPVDLDRFSEALRRWLYDRVVQIQFSLQDSTAAYTPDEAGLQVVCLGGQLVCPVGGPQPAADVAHALAPPDRAHRGKPRAPLGHRAPRRLVRSHSLRIVATGGLPPPTLFEASHRPRPRSRRFPHPSPTPTSHFLTRVRKIRPPHPSAFQKAPAGGNFLTMVKKRPRRRPLFLRSMHLTHESGMKDIPSSGYRAERRNLEETR